MHLQRRKAEIAGAHSVLEHRNVIEAEVYLCGRRDRDNAKRWFLSKLAEIITWNRLKKSRYRCIN